MYLPEVKCMDKIDGRSRRGRSVEQSRLIVSLLLAYSFNSANSDSVRAEKKKTNRGKSKKERKTRTECPVSKLIRCKKLYVSIENSKQIPCREWPFYDSCKSCLDEHASQDCRMMFEFVDINLSISQGHPGFIFGPRFHSWSSGWPCKIDELETSQIGLHTRPNKNTQFHLKKKKKRKILPKSCETSLFEQSDCFTRNIFFFYN